MSKLQEYREKRGLTQTELAKMSGVDQATISRLESGASTGMGKSWKALAVVLGCSIGELMG